MTVAKNTSEIIAQRLGLWDGSDVKLIL